MVVASSPTGALPASHVVSPEPVGRYHLPLPQGGPQGEPREGEGCVCQGLCSKAHRRKCLQDQIWKSMSDPGLTRREELGAHVPSHWAGDTRHQLAVAVQKRWPLGTSSGLCLAHGPPV